MKIKWDIGRQAASRTRHLAGKRSFHSVNIHWRRADSDLAREPQPQKREARCPFSFMLTYHHRDLVGLWKPVNVKPSGCSIDMPEAMIFSTSFWPASGTAFSGEGLLAGLTPGHWPQRLCGCGSESGWTPGNPKAEGWVCLARTFRV